MAQYGGRAVLNVRDPHESIIAWWNHNLAGSAFSLGIDKEELVESLRTREFCSFAQSEVEIWRELALDWILLGEDVMVMHHEVFKLDAVGELKRLLAFLKIPPDGKRLSCLEKHPLNFWNRGGVKLLANPYCDVAGQMISEAMIDVSQALIYKGHDPLPFHLYRDLFK